MWTHEATKLQSAEEFLKPCSSGTLEELFNNLFLRLSGADFKGISLTMEAWAF